MVERTHPVLCGGTFLSLVLESRKPSASRRQRTQGQTDAFLESDVFASLIKKEEVLTYPSLFMGRSFDYRKCVKPFQEFYYGLVTNVKEQGKAYRVIYEILPTKKPLYKQLLNDASVVLGINTNNGADVLDATCWLIKRMNLLAELSKADFDYS